jgi:2-amino-4-hydroxy-6-hydroxymethyldihydropteridine diphosphokinase
MLMNKVYLSLGSNLGDRQANLSFALQQIKACVGTITAQSALYASAPWGFESENQFLNMALAINTKLEPLALLAQLQKIEKDAGRKAKKSKCYEDRLLDIDLLLFNNLILCTDLLEIPHPRLHLRNFVLLPLAEIAPNLVHPILHRTIRALLNSCPDTSSLHPFSNN